MPPKGKGNKHFAEKTKGQRLSEMARKREERAAKAAHRKEKKAENYLSDDETFANFAIQMAKLGFELRDIPGDGNCLFRALGDQMEGHSRNHLHHRTSTVDYMVKHRADFEPFVEDDVTFERHIENLKKLGTYAGNDAIVAFARVNKVNVVIHQLGSPCLKIGGVDGQDVPELHISYHNGDHYSSVRRVGDKSETATNFRLQDDGSVAVKPSKAKVKQTASAYVEPAEPPSPSTHPIADCLEDPDLEGVAKASRSEDDIVEQVMHVTGCTDRLLVEEALHEEQWDLSLAIVYVSQIMMATFQEDGSDGAANMLETGLPVNVDDTSSTTSSSLWAADGSGTRLFGTAAATSRLSQEDAKSKQVRPGSLTSATESIMQQTVKERREQARREKKARAVERHKARLAGDAQGGAAGSLPPSNDVQTVLAKNLQMLSI